MNTMRLRFLHPALIGAVLFSLLVLTAIPASAASRQQSSVNPAVLKASPHHTPVHVTANPHALRDAGPKIHYLYVEDGTCPDSIDVYAISHTTLTHVGNFPNSACTNFAYFGAQGIDVTSANSTHGPCLVQGDQSGFVDSYTLNPNGSIAPLVSSVPDSATPSDVHISHDGQLVYVSSPGTDLESYALGAGCTLAARATVSTSHFYVSILLDGPKRFVTTDIYAGTIDTYALTASGGMTLLASVAGQIDFPDALALQTASTSSGTVQNLFTGSASGGQPQAQGGQYNTTNGTLAFLSGSPASDPSGSVGAAVFFDNADSLLVQGEQLSSTLGVYSVSAGTPGAPGSMSFLEQTPLAVSSDNPTLFVMSGPNLFVDGLFNGDIESCHPSSSGVSGCTTAAVLTNTGGSSNGMVIL
jgi:hypothetical protein